MKIIFFSKSLRRRYTKKITLSNWVKLIRFTTTRDSSHSNGWNVKKWKTIKKFHFHFSKRHIDFLAPYLLLKY